MNDKRWRLAIAGALAMILSLPAGAQVLAEALEGMRIPLAARPVSRPMTVAYVPEQARYIIADGGFAAMADEYGNIASKSLIHVYDAKGNYVSSAKPGLNNKTVYFNPNQNRLETVTYNVSSDVGMLPLCGVYSLELDKEGKLTNNSDMLSGPNPAFGDAATFPTYDPAENQYYAKQGRSDRVLVVKLDKREPVREIKLDLAAAGARFDDISDSYVAFTGIPGEELAVLDVDHKAVLVFDLKGKFVGRSALPSAMKLRANNHYSGHGYANGMFFVYHESEGEFGTYYGFRISDQAK
ncbi:MAG TPA: hypothetical protein PKW44_06670 [Methylophilaceae bacterium]|nr:hypothetical protein [Methylophilaceae bacterium]HQR60635.1 hypothetical protein [Methylophilaceae bacterium]